MEEKGTAVETHTKSLCDKLCPEHKYSYVTSLGRQRLKIKQFSVVVLWSFERPLLIWCCLMVVSTEFLVMCLRSGHECNTQVSGALPCREPFQSYLAAYQATLSPQVCRVPFVMEGQGGATHLQMCGVPGQQIGSWQ